MNRENGLSLNNEVASCSRSSLLLNSVEFKASPKEETLAINQSLKTKYTFLTPDISTKSAGSKTDAAFKFKANGQFKGNFAVNGFHEHNGGDHSATPEDGIPPPKVTIASPAKVCLEWKEVNKVGSGLFNMGNTCFMNAVLQCLSYCPPLVNLLLYNNDDHFAKCRVSFCMICEMQKHVKRLYLHSPGDAIKPAYIYQRLKQIAKHFQFGRQEDAHEFLRYVVDNMWRSCVTNYEARHNNVKLDSASKETTEINHLFGGYHRSQVTCFQCKEKSNTFDYFMDFMLDIKNVMNLEKALEKFIQPEILQQENAYKCARCQKKVPAQKRFTVHRAPNVATFQFKRFDYNRMFGGKITKHIVYPETLNLRPYMSETKGAPIMYKLNAVLVHLGATCNSGHYFCYAKNSNGSWYMMDDSRVAQVSLNHVLNQQAYILFYVRTSRNDHMTPVKKPQITPFATVKQPQTPTLAANRFTSIASKPTTSKVNGNSGILLSLKPQTLATINKPKIIPIQSKAVATSNPPEKAGIKTIKNGISPTNGSKVLVPYAADSSEEEETEIPALNGSHTATQKPIQTVQDKLPPCRTAEATASKASEGEISKDVARNSEGSGHLPKSDLHQNPRFTQLVPILTQKKSQQLEASVNGKPSQIKIFSDSPCNVYIKVNQNSPEKDHKESKSSSKEEQVTSSIVASATTSSITTVVCNSSLQRSFSLPVSSPSKVTLNRKSNPIVENGLLTNSSPQIQKVKATTSWSVSDQSLQSPSIASGSSTNSFNSTTDWNVIDPVSDGIGSSGHSKHFQNKRRSRQWTVTPTKSFSNTANIPQNPAQTEPPQPVALTSDYSKVTEDVTKVVSTKFANNLLENGVSSEAKKPASDVMSERMEKKDSCPPRRRSTESHDSSAKRSSREGSCETVSDIKSRGRKRERSETKSSSSSRSRSRSTDSETDSQRKKKCKKRKKKHRKHRDSSSSDSDSSSKKQRKLKKKLKKMKKLKKKEKEREKEKEKEKKKHKKHSNKQSSRGSPEEDKSEAELEWVERTKETLDQEKEKRVVDERKWNEGVPDLTNRNAHRLTNGYIKSPEESSDNKTLDELQAMSLQSFGSNVRTWAGDSNAIDKQVKEERHRESRLDVYNEEFDQGKVKKVKGQVYNRGREWQQTTNPFQSFQHSRHQTSSWNQGSKYNNEGRFNRRDNSSNHRHQNHHNR